MRPYHIQKSYIFIVPSDWELLTQNGGQSFPLSDAFPAVLETDTFSTFRILGSKLSILTKVSGDPETLLNYVAIGSDATLSLFISHISVFCVHKLWPSLPMLSFFFSLCPHAHLLTSAFLPVKRLFILPSYPSSPKCSRGSFGLSPEYCRAFTLQYKES